MHRVWRVLDNQALAALWNVLGGVCGFVDLVVVDAKALVVGMRGLEHATRSQSEIHRTSLKKA